MVVAGVNRPFSFGTCLNLTRATVVLPPTAVWRVSRSGTPSAESPDSWISQVVTRVEGRAGGFMLQCVSRLSVPSDSRIRIRFPQCLESAFSPLLARARSTCISVQTSRISCSKLTPDLPILYVLLFGVSSFSNPFSKWVTLNTCTPSLCNPLLGFIWLDFDGERL